MNGEPLTDEDRRKIERAAGPQEDAGASRPRPGSTRWRTWSSASRPPPSKDGELTAGRSSSRLPGQGRRPGLLGDLVRPLHRGSAVRARAGRALKDRPFALLGVNATIRRRTPRQGDERGRSPGPTGTTATTGGPIATLYRVRGYPSMFLLDAKGVIRSPRRVVRRRRHDRDAREGGRDRVSLRFADIPAVC